MTPWLTGDSMVTWRTLSDAAAEEPPSRVEWSIEAAGVDGSVTRVRVRHDDLGLSPATWALVGSERVEATARLKTLLETGHDLGPLEPRRDLPSTDEVDPSWHRSQVRPPDRRRRRRPRLRSGVYAVEARASAMACLGRLDEAGAARRRAIEVAAVIADAEDRAILEADLAAGPWFGLDPG
ncbi:MAG: hypothetical protein AAGA93_17080 [Actinomycetota bacterium]